MNSDNERNITTKVLMFELLIQQLQFNVLGFFYLKLNNCRAESKMEKQASEQRSLQDTESFKRL